MPDGPKNGKGQPMVGGGFSDALLASIVDSSDDAIISKDIEGHITSWNKSAERMFGYSAEEALGQSITLILPPDRLHEERHIQERILRGERIDHFETRRKHRDGRNVDVSVTISPVRDGQGRIIGASKVARNIGDQRRTAELRGLLAAIIASSDDAIISKDLNSIITTWNGAAQRIFGYTAAEVIGRPVWMLFPPDRINEEAGILEKIKRGQRVDHFETVRMRKDGSLVELSVTISPITDADGKVIGASKIARDISDQRRIQRSIEMAHLELEHANRQLRSLAGNLEDRVREKTEQLQQSSQDWEAFAYSISHDLRAHLRAILNFAAILQQQLEGKFDAQEKNYFDRIVRAADRISVMVDGVLAFTKVARAELELHEVSVDSVVSDLVHSSQELQAPASQLRIQSPLGRVLANRAGLHQCLANLLGNAVKYVAPKTTPVVVVRSESRGEFLRIWIEDNGIGIPPDEQMNLFQMFQRMNNASGYQGTGLGLAIVRRAAERMGGKVGVESNYGQGSRFWLELKKAPDSPR